MYNQSSQFSIGRFIGFKILCICDCIPNTNERIISKSSYWIVDYILTVIRNKAFFCFLKHRMRFRIFVFWLNKISIISCLYSKWFSRIDYVEYIRVSRKIQFSKTVTLQPWNRWDELFENYSVHNLGGELQANFFSN